MIRFALLAALLLLTPMDALAGSQTLLKGDVLQASTSGRIGSTGSPDSKAVLDLVSTTLGFLPPRMTTTQRDAISSPTEGLACYNSTTKFPNVYNGTSWLEVLTATGTQTVTGKSIAASEINSGQLALAQGGTNADLSATGGTSQVLKQTSSGAAVSVARLACADLSNAATSCSTDTTSASNISSGTLAVARGGTNLGSGTSGGILGFTASGTLASSVALTASQLVLGGGAGATPTALAAGSQYVPLTMGASNPGYTALALNQSAATSGQLLASRGGTGQDFSASTGIIQVASGTFSAGTLTHTSGGTDVTSPGTAGNVLASDGTNFASTDIMQSNGIRSVGLSTSISSNTLIVNLVQGDGSTNCSASIPCLIATRSATAATGSYSTQSVTAAKSITLGTTASVGNPSGAGAIVYVYWIQDTTSEMCVSGFPFDEGSLWSATATPSTGSTVLYCANTHTSRPIRLLGRVTASWSNPNWSAVTEVALGPFATSNVIPMTVQRFTSGSSATYTLPTSPRRPAYIIVTALGGGGAGGASGTASWGSPGSSGNTTFGSSLITCNGGANGGQSGNAAGGSSTVNSPAVQIHSGNGATGGGAQYDGTASSAEPQINGGNGGGTPLSGGGAGGAYGTAGQGAPANSGGGGGGGGGGGSAILGFYSGGGGGAGAYIRAVLTNPAATYTYTVGSGGSAASAGTNGYASGAGAAGIIIVEEYYQ